MFEEDAVERAKHRLSRGAGVGVAIWQETASDREGTAWVCVAIDTSDRQGIVVLHLAGQTAGHRLSEHVRSRLETWLEDRAVASGVNRDERLDWLMEAGPHVVGWDAFQELTGE
jgi:hypothetical protein